MGSRQLWATWIVTLAICGLLLAAAYLR